MIETIFVALINANLYEEAQQLLYIEGAGFSPSEEEERIADLLESIPTEEWDSL